MGPMVRGPKLSRRTISKWSALGLTGLMLWSLVAAPTSYGEEQDVVEPYELSAYYTYADAMPVQGFFDHQARLVGLGPGIAHSQSELAMPSAASGIAWLADMGIANGLHGTTTGNRVPTEASAKQPGGAERDEFSVAGGPLGNEATARVQAGRAFASASHSDSPRGYASAFLGNIYVLPAAGVVGQDPPGSYNPDQTFPGGDLGAPSPDPAPQGQMAILSVGSIASTTESRRDGTKVISVGVAEVNDVNIGNRTSDGRCTNCYRLDSIRAEAYAEASGYPGGAKASYRVILGRACRRSFDGALGKEVDQCLPLGQTNQGLQSVGQLEQLNQAFTTGFGGYTIGVRIHAGAPHEDPARAEKTSSPPEDRNRNYAYPDTRLKDPSDPTSGQVNPDTTAGQEATAVAEGIEVEIFTITTTQVLEDAMSKTGAGKALADLNRSLEQNGAPTIPVATVKSVRRLQLTLGVAQASAVARPCEGCTPPEDEVEGTQFFEIPEINIPEITIPEFTIPEFPSGGGGTTIVNQGFRNGTLAVKVNWASMRLKPWPAKDMAKGILSGGIIGAMVFLVRRRLRLG